MRRYSFIFFVVCFLGLQQYVRAGIIIDYSHDTYFSTNATAKAALEAAANDINTALNLNNTLSAIGAGDYEQTELNGGATSIAALTYSGFYTNPTTDVATSITGEALGVDEIRIFVGMRIINDTTDTDGDGVLGIGGPAVVGVSSVGGGGDPGGFQDAVDVASTAGNAVFDRGGGPTISSVTQNFDLGGGFVASATTTAHSTFGTITFDGDTDDDNIFDNPTELDDFWHFDHTSAVASTKYDFYSVALHEMLHAIGYGVSDSWDANVSGTDWLGTNAIAEHGTGTGLVDAGGGHLTAGTMSTSIVDGSPQEVVMDPNIANGQRKFLTDLDIAILQDFGWTTASANSSAVPEPSSMILLSIMSVGCLFFWRRKSKQQDVESIQTAA